MFYYTTIIAFPYSFNFLHIFLTFHYIDETCWQIVEIYNQTTDFNFFFSGLDEPEGPKDMKAIDGK